MNFHSKCALITIVVFTWLSAQLAAQSDYGTHFRHEVTPANQQGILTYVDHEELNNNPEAIFIATPNQEPNGVSPGYQFSLSYEADMEMWAIRHASGQGQFPIGSTFNILIPSAIGSFFRAVAPGGDSVFLIDHPSVNGKVNKTVFINPIYPGYTIGNGKGEFIAVYLPSPFQKWGVGRTPPYNIEAGETFNVFVPDESEYTYVHRITEPSHTTLTTKIDHPLLNNNPEANFLFQRRFTFHNNASTTHNNRDKSAVYINGSWYIKIAPGNN